MSETPRTEAGRRLLGELSESPLPGARYAHDVVSRRIHAVEREANELGFKNALRGVKEAEEARAALAHDRPSGSVAMMHHDHALGCVICGEPLSGSSDPEAE